MLKKINEIISYASKACSFYNTKPWKIYIDGRRVFVGYDCDKILKYADPFKKNLYLSLGSFIEAFYLSSGAFGIKSEVKYISKNYFCAVINLYSCPVYNSDVLNLIKNRKTNRDLYSDNFFSDGDIALLRAGFPNLLYIPRGSDKGEALSSIIYSSMALNFGDSTYLREISHWVTFNNNFRNSGLVFNHKEPLNILNLFKRKPTSSLEILSSGHFIKKILAFFSEQVENSSGWLIIASKTDSLENTLIAGRVFYRLAISAQAENIYLQPFSYHSNNTECIRKIKEIAGMYPHMVIRAGYGRQKIQS